MPAIPLADRLTTLPLILAGPIPRRTEPRSVTVWVALHAPRTVTLEVYERDAAGQLQPRLSGARHTVRLGDALHIAAVSARLDGDAPPLTPGTLYYYNLYFDDGPTPAADPQRLPSLTTPGVLLADPDRASELERLVYPGHPLPAVVLPADELGAVRFFHGSCRKPHGTGHDALAALDIALAAAAGDPRERPQQLFLTGDQIYADDVASAVLATLIELERGLFAGNTAEALPLVGVPAAALAPTTRAGAVLELAHFTTGTASNHCMSYAEYCGLYLLSWSGVLWPSVLPTIEEIWAAHPSARPTEAKAAQGEREHDAAQRAHIEDFLTTLPQVRRALANIATYMIFDDHDVTDDWFLDGAWCEHVLASSLGWRVVRNALLAYAFFQAWGNDPDAFEAEAGRELLAAVDAWRGDETDERAAAINARLGMPSGFGGAGELPHPAGSLRWHFSVPTPRYTAIALDERTRRIYRSPNACPGRIAPDAMAEQIAPIRATTSGATTSGATTSGAELTVLIAPTPVLGVELVERVQSIANNNYTFDREAWSLDRITYQALLRTLAPLERVVILSGDVHYGFAASMEYWDETTQPPRTATVVNCVSSSLKNETGGTQKALLTVAYPEIFWLLSRGQLPPLEFFAWDLYSGDTQALAEALAAIRKRALHPWWALSHLLDALNSTKALVLPARGWPPGTFADCAPERRYRVRYLHDRCLAQGLAQGGSPAAPSGAKPSGKNAALPKELARIHAAQVTPGEVLTTLDTLQTLRAEAQAEEQAEARPSTQAAVAAAHPHREALIARALEGVRGVVRSAKRAEQAVTTRLSDFLQEHRALWNRAWQEDLHIVGETNLGEIRFDPATGEVIQYLWWWHPHEAAAPTPATEYRAPLRLPAPGGAPALPHEPRHQRASTA
jgi:hypothetical protein